MTDNLPHALILAGGKSSRWGNIDKGLIEWQGLPLVEHVVKRLQKQARSIHVSCNQNQQRYAQIVQKYLPPTQANHLPICFEDKLLQDRGPLGGIFEFLSFYESARLNAPTEMDTQVFICCCDTPLIPENLVSTLQNKMESINCDAVYPKSNTSDYWLNLLVNSEKALASLSQLSPGTTERRSFSVKNWLSHMHSASITTESDQPYLNINSQSDLDRLKSTTERTSLNE